MYQAAAVEQKQQRNNLLYNTATKNSISSTAPRTVSPSPASTYFKGLQEEDDEVGQISLPSQTIVFIPQEEEKVTDENEDTDPFVSSVSTSLMMKLTGSSSSKYSNTKSSPLMSTSSLPLPDFDDENLHRRRHKEDMLKEQRISNRYSNKSSQITNSTDDNKLDKNSDRIRDAENENVENINTGSEMEKCIDNNNNNNSSKNSSSHSDVAIQNDGNSAAVSVNRSNDKSVDINDTDNNDGGGDGCGSSRERFNNKYCNDIQRIRKQCGAIVNNFYVQLVMVAFIVINAIMMGIATYDFIKDNPEYSRAFELTDKTFLVIFTIELVMQGIYHGIYMFKDGWLVFDFIIISISWAFQEVQIVRAFRIFRAFRLLTRVKIMRNLILGKHN